MWKSMVSAIKRWRAEYNMSEEERFLSRSVDHADLAQRMQILEERHRWDSPYEHMRRGYWWNMR